MRERQANNFRVNDLRKLEVNELLTIWFHWQSVRLNENSSDGKLICSRIINKLQNVLDEKNIHWFRIAKTFVPTKELKSSDKVSQFFNIQNANNINL